MLASSEQPPDGAVAVENDTRETHTAAVTVSDALGEMLLNRTFDVVGGGLVATDPVIQRQGTCAIRAVVGDTSREAEVTFEREGPDGEKVYGYILIFFDDPPIEITIEGPPIGTDSP